MYALIFLMVYLQKLKDPEQYQKKKKEKEKGGKKVINIHFPRTVQRLTVQLTSANEVRAEGI